MKTIVLDKDWWKESEDLARSELKTAKALDKVLIQRQGEVRSLLQKRKEKDLEKQRERPAKIEKLYSTSYWADQLDFEEDTICSWCRSGDLDGQWIRGQYRISERAMKAFLDKEEVKRRG